MAKKTFNKWQTPTMSEKTMEERWLSVDEIAAHLGIKRDTVYNWISERQMQGYKIGRLWKFDKRAVDEWVKSCAASAKGDDIPIHKNP